MNKEVLLKNLGEKIRAIRKEAGVSQAQLAHSIGKDQQSIQRLEAGNINPSYVYLQEIAEGLNVTLIDILTKNVSDKTWLKTVFDYKEILGLGASSGRTPKFPEGSAFFSIY